VNRRQKKPNSIFFFILLFVGINFFFDQGSAMGFQWVNIIPIIILFTVIPMIIRNMKNPKTNEDSSYSGESDPFTEKMNTIVCDYCGETIDKSSEYCEKCGAAQLID